MDRAAVVSPEGVGARVLLDFSMVLGRTWTEENYSDGGQLNSGSLSAGCEKKLNFLVFLLHLELCISQNHGTVEVGRHLCR